MPSRPRTFCINGCKAQSISDSRLCATCDAVRQKKIDARRAVIAKKRTARFGTSREQGYDWQWEKVSKHVRRNEPICRMCKNALASCVDHIVPIKQGGERLAIDNLQPLCHKCHAVKTAQDVSRYKVV